ncbi:MAG: hypothetical protein JO261_02515 [Alphaproteobacteria bacterium]|nr:hypothetical protein [Alphaproteobacteria bacterium]MBV9692551.1 hypothetical protein [Alphaproteobacteria bacterium]
MTVTMIVQALEALAALLGQLVPLFEEGQSVVGETDVAQVHAALAKAEAATATLRPQVDAALAQAAAK